MHPIPRTLSAFFAASMLLGCSPDKSLGGGIAPMDSAIASPDGPHSSLCDNRVGIDASASVGSNAGLVAWYRLESAAGAAATTLPDSSSRGNDGALMSQAGNVPGYSFAPGKVGNALTLSAAAMGHATLPAGMLTGACEASLAAWVYPNTIDNPWMRVWDFGSDTTSYMFLTPSTNYDTRAAKFAITVGGYSQEEWVSAPAPLPAQVWTHVAVVMGPTGVTLYVDGAAVGTNTALRLRPADLGRTMNNFIGRSQYTTDAYLDGAIDEFRVYDRALSPSEIQALARGQH